LEGTIRWDRSTEEGRVRVNPQLIRVSDDVHLWADRYDAVIDDIFAVQAEIAEKVVEELDITLLDSERQTLTEQPSENTEAYDYYLKGRKYFGNHTAKDYMNAEAMFQKAIELEPDFVSALAWLSIVHTQIYSWYLDRTDERLAAAKEAADRALEIGPDIATAHAALAWYHYAGVEDSEKALGEFTALRERQPSDAMFNFCIALIEQRQGKWEEALVDYERAIKLDPRSATFCGEYGTALYCLRRYNEAESLYNRAIELKPDMQQPHVNKSLIYVYRDGDITGAKQVLQEALQMNDRWPDLTDREATLEALEGNYDRALTLLNDIRDISDIPAYDSACYYSLKGSIYRYMNQTDLMESCYDSARVILDRLVSAETEDPWYHAELGMVLAGLGCKQEAMHHGRLAVELSETTENTSDRADLISYLADTYAIVGEYDLAIDQFDYLLSVPSQMSIPLLKIWPDYAPLRDHPRFQALIDKYEKIHGI
ncbi:MAG: tetratricopeptide repeat protein, partial [Candidatus Zixiibacteriota bacterium]